MLSWIALTSVAFAADPGPLVPRISPRTVKVDLFLFAPGLHPWGSDWKMTLMEQWSAVLDCKPAGGQLERCELPHGVWWGAVLQGTTEVKLVKVPAPGAIEIRWTPRGRAASWDVVGDRSAFWTEISNTMLKLTFHRQDVVFKPDAQREIGQEVEGVLARQLAAALEWELPKKGDASKAWAPSQTPWVGRRWVQSTSSHKVVMQAAGQSDQSVEIALSGTVAERLAEGSVGDLTVETKVVGRATWDRALGTVTRAKTETVSTATSGRLLVGHTRSITVVAPWKAGDPTEPLDMPEPELP